MERFIRKFVEEERAAFVNEVLQSGSNILIAKKYDIHPCLLSKWVIAFGYSKAAVLRNWESEDQPIMHSLK